MIRRRKDVKKLSFEKCHDGIGTLDCFSMLENGDSDFGVTFFHHDIIPQGVSIGEHKHEGSEEIYYLLSGTCELIYDGEKTPMTDGDISIVKDGHSHGITNTGDKDAVLIVVGIAKK